MQFEIAVHIADVDAVVNTVPVSAGNVMVFVPAVEGPAIVSVPEVEPINFRLLPAASAKSFLTVVVPVVAPRLNVVAAPKAFTVVAVVLNTSNEVLPVVTLVVNDGLVPNTSTPVPVSSLTTPASSDDVVAANWLNLPPV